MIYSPDVRHARLIFLTTFLIAALATQRVLSLQPGLTETTLDLPSVTAVARRLARRLSRRDQTPQRRFSFERARHASKRLTLAVRVLVGYVVQQTAFTPFLFRLPPPVGA